MAGLSGLFGRNTPAPRASNGSVETHGIVESRETALMCQYNSGSRVSKFEGLQGFVLKERDQEVKVAYTFGQAVNWAKVGRIYYINHPRDDEIHNRVVVIFRTNNDSWSCYGFCKHPDKDDCENQDFRDEHAQIVAQRPARRQNVNSVPRIELSIRDADNNDLTLEPDLWINCRQMLDIKHTVQVAPLGSVEKNSLEELLRKSRDVFNNTFGDLDKGMLRRTPDSRGGPSLSPPPSQELGTSPGRRVERHKKMKRSTNPFHMGSY